MNAGKKGYIYIVYIYTTYNMYIYMFYVTKFSSLGRALTYQSVDQERRHSGLVCWDDGSCASLCQYRVGARDRECILTTGFLHIGRRMFEFLEAIL